MKHFIIGTAGHVDHGKSALIKALTGIDTHHLPEEKSRGLTIDLGFARISCPGELNAGIVDVPGHERFLRNMLAGVGGIDCALLVVDVHEGIKPQTVEHLEILDLLAVPAAVVALTKIDLASAQEIDSVDDDLEVLLEGTVFSGAPRIRVSALTGEGLEELKAALAGCLEKLEPRDSSAPVFLPIDRAFTLAGFGTMGNAVWVQGDFNYDQKVNTIDFNDLAGNFGAVTLASPTLGSVVPEPASLGVFAIAGLLLRRRR